MEDFQTLDDHCYISCGVMMALCRYIESMCSPKLFVIDSQFWVSIRVGRSAEDEPDLTISERWFPCHLRQFENVENIAAPMHRSNHWTLALIQLRRRHILHYDSLGGVDVRADRMLLDLRSWIVDYMKRMNRFNRTSDSITPQWPENPEAWTFENMTKTGIGYAPTQTDGSSCGLYVLLVLVWLTLGVKPLSQAGNELTDARLQHMRKVLKCLLLAGSERPPNPIQRIEWDSGSSGRRPSKSESIPGPGSLGPSDVEEVNENSSKNRSQAVVTKNRSRPGTSYEPDEHGTRRTDEQRRSERDRMPSESHQRTEEESLKLPALCDPAVFDAKHGSRKIVVPKIGSIFQEAVQAASAAPVALAAPAGSSAKPNVRSTVAFERASGGEAEEESRQRQENTANRNTLPKSRISLTDLRRFRSVTIHNLVHEAKRSDSIMMPLANLKLRSDTALNVSNDVSDLD